jgi:hypothetical protein
MDFSFMSSNNIKLNQEFKVCACKNCNNFALRLMEINYIHKKGYFCDTCADEITFLGLGYGIYKNKLEHTDESR